MMRISIVDTCTIKRDLPPVANLKPDLVSGLTYLSVSVALLSVLPLTLLWCSITHMLKVLQPYSTVGNAHAGGVRPPNWVSK